MKLKTYLKSAIAGFTAFAMAVTMVPTNGFGNVQAASTDGDMILHWDMTTVTDDEGKLKDLTGNTHHGIMNGSVTNTTIEGIDVLDMTGGYVDIPDGTIGSDVTEVTVNMLVKISENIPGSWMFGIGSSNSKYLYFTGCCSANQGSVMRGGVGNGSPGWSHESVINGTEALNKDEWQNVTVTYTDGGKFIFYKNGEKQAETVLSEGDAGTFTLQDLMTAGDERDGYMGWSFYNTGSKPDPKFQGKVADFRIYDKAMSDAEVTELSTEIDTMLKNLADGDFSAADIDLSEADCLASNASKDKITADLTLPAKTTIGGKADKEAAISKWVSSNPKVIANDGKVTRPLTDETVTLTATVTRGEVSVDKTLTFAVLGDATPQQLVDLMAEQLTIPNASDIRGNITLPTTGKIEGSTITWKSSNDAIINSKDNGTYLAGVVTRPADQDTKVTLTATITLDSATKDKTIECTVKKAYDMPETTDYIFAYFPYANTKDERIYFGISEDGLNFEALNNSKFVLESKLGTHGLRDPFIIRSPEGDRFYLIATDLTVAGIEQDGQKYPGQSWDDNQVKGSQKIMVWESTDLVNWSEQRECKVAVDTAGCTWAPEAYWDDATGQYVVFWSSKVSDDGNSKQRIYYATTRDFYSFSPAKVWIDTDVSVIDATVIKAGEYFYRYIKNEDAKPNKIGTPGKRVYCERSKSLTTADWELVHNNSLDVSGNQIEGPTIFKLNKDDTENAKKIAKLKGFDLTGDDIYCLMADQTGVTVFPGLSDDITKGNFNILGNRKNETVGDTKIYSMPEPDASHGTIMPITAEEYHNLMMKYNTAYAADAPGLIEKADAAEKELNLTPTTVTSDLKLPASTSNGAQVTWASSNEKVITFAGKVTRPKDADTKVVLTATITVKGTEAVRDQIRTKSFTVTVKKAETVTPPPATKKYTVKFDAKGGSKVNTQTIASGKKVIKPKNPTKKNYLFSGWYNGKTKYNFSKPVTKNLTLTAKWTKVKVGTAKISSLKNKKSKQLTVSIKKVSGAAGYQVTYSTDKKFKKGKNTKVVYSKKNTVTLKKLKKGKTYYVKVKAYKLDSKKLKVLGKFSAVKKIKIKK